MARKLTIDPVTRIEGHARVEIDVDDANRVTSSVFKVLDFRGFETFMRGMQVENMPTLTARICGTCPQAHHLASARTVDKVFGVQIPRTAELMRMVLNMGAIVHSHSVHFFALAGPDLMFGIQADPAKRNILGLVEATPNLATKALQLRSIGQRIVELVGGRGTHPVSSVVGGMAAPIAKDKQETLKNLATEGLSVGQALYAAAKKVLLSKMDLVEALPLPSHYLGTVNAGRLDFYQGPLRLCAPDGQRFEFSEDEWTSHLFEEAVPTSYAKHVFCKAGQEAVSYRVGPLARLNCVDSISTPAAQAELEEMRSRFGAPTHHTVLYHFARLIELLHALEMLPLLVNDAELYAPTVRAKPGTPRSATAHIEAPRGVLIHDYKVDANGIVTDANLIVATQQNAPAINATIGMAAQKFIDQPDPILLNAIEFAVRCYDPCLSCATHRIGEMKLDVVVRKGGETVRRARR